MAKKKDVISSPTVTNLPLPISETPLVIDLPDGQKLVIGKMSNGSIIEVATWRGTGRPDSRTNRLMLGMSSGAKLLIVCHCERQHGAVIRIISARKASRHETLQYR